MRYLSLVICSALLLASALLPEPVAAQAAPNEPVLLTLESGLRVLVDEQPEASEITGVVRLELGSDDDQEGRPGAARLLLEAIVRGGSNSRPAKFVETWLSEHGAKLELVQKEGHAELHFHCTPEDCAEFLTIIADLLGDPALTEAALESSREHVIALLQTGGELNSTNARQRMRAISQGRLAAPSLTTVTDAVKMITAEHLLELHAERIGTGRVMVGIAGPTDQATLNEVAAEAFASLPRLPERATGPPTFTAAGELSLHVFDAPAAKQTEISIGTAIAPIVEADAAALAIWAHALELSSEGDETPTFTVDLEHGWGRNGRLGVTTLAANEEVGKGLRTLLDHIEARLAPLSAEELAAAKTGVTISSQAVATNRKESLSLALTRARYGYAASLNEDFDQALAAATAESVAEAAGRYVAPRAVYVIAVGPAATITPQLEAFGEVTLGSGGEEAVGFDEPPLVGAMFEAIGGRESWATLAAFEVDVNLISDTGETPMRHYHDLEEMRFRVDYDVDGSQVAVALDKTVMWQKTEKGTQVMGPRQVETQIRTKRRRFWEVLHHLALGQLDVWNDYDDRLDIVRDEAHLIIEVDEDRRPRVLQYTHNGQPFKFTYSDWVQKGDMWFPSVVDQHSTGTEWHFGKVKRLEKFDAELVKME